MRYFDRSFIVFFNELEDNNNKQWFHAHKKQYEQSVKKPMLNFVTDVIDGLRAIDKSIDLDPKKCIGRINRDIRFSKDKTPYRTHLFAHMTKGAKEDPAPLVAFRMGARDFSIMSGYYQPTRSRLKRIRDKIGSDVMAFRKLYADAAFVSKYGRIRGEANKRIPSEYKSVLVTEPLIANKQFYYVKKFKADVILGDNLLPLLMEYYHAAQPMNDYLSG